MNGHLGLRTALFALILAPEAYLPLRQLGANYHASAEGMAAAEQVFAVLEAPEPAQGTRTDFPDPALTDIAVEGLRVSYPDRSEPALDGVSLTVGEGEVLALVGPSGCGKSTLLSVLLGLVTPELGGVRVGGIDLTEVDLDAWRARLAWVPQRPHLFKASIAQNVRLGRSGASTDEVWAAISAAGLTDVVRNLPDGLDTLLGDRGSGLSAGERQRVALARAFLRDAPLLLLDEPTAGADPDTRTALLRAVRARASDGAAVLYTTHYLPELTDLGATIAVARSGRVIARGDQDTLITGLPGELRLRLDGAAGAGCLPGSIAGRAQIVDGELRISSADPPADLAALLTAGCSPVSVDVRRPDLDDLYSALALEASHAV
jgi:ABC-type transport system involved in cytochrome bd biosynthesis fused ATPase/permease subunit